MSAITYSVGQLVTYRHGLLEEDIRARVFSSSPRGIVIELDDVENGWPRDRRFLTHNQARVSLTARKES